MAFQKAMARNDSKRSTTTASVYNKQTEVYWRAAVIANRWGNSTVLFLSFNCQELVILVLKLVVKACMAKGKRLLLGHLAAKHNIRSSTGCCLGSAWFWVWDNLGLFFFWCFEQFLKVFYGKFVQQLRHWWFLTVIAIKRGRSVVCDCLNSLCDEISLQGIWISLKVL